MSTERVSPAVVNISMNNPCAREAPLPRTTPTRSGPGVSPSTSAAATMPPIICAKATTERGQGHASFLDRSPSRFGAGTRGRQC